MAERDELAELFNRHGEYSTHEGLADIAIAAGYSKPFQVSPGRYRNELGVVLNVTSQHSAPRLIGTIWNAEQDEGVFGRRFLIVSPDGLRDAGYQRVEE